MALHFYVSESLISLKTLNQHRTLIFTMSTGMTFTFLLTAVCNNACRQLVGIMYRKRAREYYCEKMYILQHRKLGRCFGRKCSQHVFKPWGFGFDALNVTWISTMEPGWPYKLKEGSQFIKPILKQYLHSHMKFERSSASHFSFSLSHALSVWLTGDSILVMCVFNSLSETKMKIQISEIKWMSSKIKIFLAQNSLLDSVSLLSGHLYEKRLMFNSWND